MRKHTIELTNRELVMVAGAVQHTLQRVISQNTLSNVDNLVEHRYSDLFQKLDALIVEDDEATEQPTVGKPDSLETHTVESIPEPHAPVGLTDPFNQPAVSQADGLGDDSKIPEVTPEPLCKCGHPIAVHSESGCMVWVNNAEQPARSYCRCTDTHDRDDFDAELRDKLSV